MSPVAALRPLAILAVGVFATPCSLTAQAGSVVTGGLGLVGVFMVGEDIDAQDAGVGLLGAVDFRPAGWRGVGVMLEGGWIPLEDDRDGLGRQKAENTLLHVLVGPIWRPVVGLLRPEVAIVAGAISSRWSLESAAVSENGSGSAGAWGGWAGLGVDLGREDHPLTLRVQGRVLDPGVLPFGRAPLPSSPEGLPGVTRWDPVLLSVAVELTVGL